MFRLSQPKSGMFRLYRPMLRLPRPLFWYFVVCLVFLDQNRVYSVFVLDLCFDFLNQIWVCFEFIDLCFNFLDLCLTFLTHIFLFCGPKSGLFCLFCSTYVSTFSTQIGYVSALSTCVSTSSTSVFTFLTYVLTFWAKVRYVSSFVLDLCFDFRNGNRICFDFIDLCFEFLDICFEFIDLRFDFLDHKRVLFWFCKRPMFRLSQTKAGMFRIYRPMFWLPRPLIWLSWLNFCFLDQNPVCLDFCAQPIVRI